MKNLKDIISEKLIINKSTKIDGSTTKYHPQDKEELKEIVNEEIKRPYNNF